MEENKATAPGILKKSTWKSMSDAAYADRLKQMERTIEEYAKRIEEIEFNLMELFEADQVAYTIFTMYWDPSKEEPSITQLKREKMLAQLRKMSVMLEKLSAKLVFLACKVKLSKRVA